MVDEEERQERIRQGLRKIRVQEGEELAALLQTLHCHYLSAVGLDGEDGAGLDRPTVQNDGASPAVSRIASDVGTSKTQGLSDEMDQQESRFYFPFSLFSVYADLDLNCGRWTCFYSHVQSPDAGGFRPHS